MVFCLFFCPHSRYDPSNDSALNCDSERSKKLVECQGQINLDVFVSGTDITIKANISINGDWYIICQSYDPVDIGKKYSITHT